MYYPYARQEVIRVNGKNGADAYQMAPNSSVLLLDETAPIIWLKTTDGASYPTVTGYEIRPMVDKQTSLEERIARLEKMLDEKSNDTGVEQKRNTKHDKQYKESDDE